MTSGASAARAPPGSAYRESLLRLKFTSHCDRVRLRFHVSTSINPMERVSKLIRAAGTYRMQPPFGMPSYIFHSEPARRKLIHTLAVLIFNVLNTLKETVKYLVATYAYFTLRLHKTFPRERSRLTIDPNYQTRLSPASRAGSGRSNPICRQKNYLCFDRKQFRSSL